MSIAATTMSVVMVGHGRAVRVVSLLVSVVVVGMMVACLTCLSRHRRHSCCLTVCHFHIVTAGWAFRDDNLGGGHHFHWLNGHVRIRRIICIGLRISVLLSGGIFRYHCFSCCCFIVAKEFFFHRGPLHLLLLATHNQGDRQSQPNVPGHRGSRSPSPWKWQRINWNKLYFPRVSGFDPTLALDFVCYPMHICLPCVTVTPAIQANQGRNVNKPGPLHCK